MKPVIFRLGGISGCALALLLLYWSLRIGWSDWIAKDRTKDSILQAIHLFPENSLYYRFWAEIESSDGVIALRQAAKVNPLSSAIRMELASNAERLGDLNEAEASLLKAVSLDLTFGPRWLLSDFYFRHHQLEKFWPAVKEALNHDNSEMPLLFANCWALSSDANLILKRAIPDKPEVLRAYLTFLAENGHLEAARPIASRLIQSNDGPQVTEPLLNYCDRLATNNDSPQAVSIWNWLSTRKFIPYAILEPKRPLTNGDFAIEPKSKAFDWRPLPTDGLYVEYAKQSKSLNLTFTGKQPEKCEILSQFIPLNANGEYRLRIRYRTTDLPKQSGLTWHLATPTGEDLLLGAGIMPGTSPSTDDSQLEAPFAAPQTPSICRLVLAYERIKGTVRIEGTAEIRNVEISFAQ